MPYKLKGTLTEGKFETDALSAAEYSHDWVAARNLVMLALLTGIAESEGRGNIAFGGNLEEAGAHPDNEWEFGTRFNELLPYSTQNGVKVELLQPLRGSTKTEIFQLGESLRVPWALTWSCYSNQKKPCGTCGSCERRQAAFSRNGMVDPLTY